MNERKHIREFVARLDSALHSNKRNGPAAVGDDQDLITLAQTLVAADLSQESTRLGQIRADLVQKTAARRPDDRRQNQPVPIRLAWRALAIGLLLCLILTGAVLAIPPLRSLAQDILGQIGTLIFTNAPTDYEIVSQTPTLRPFSTPIPGGVRQVVESQLRSAQEVSALAGFTMSTPDYVPDGYQLAARDAWLVTGKPAALSTYHSAASDDSLGIQQALIIDGEARHEFGVGEAPVVELAVRGVTGLWVEQYAVWPGTGVNMLVWEERGFMFTLHSAHLSLDEMLRVAESLTP